MQPSIKSFINSIPEKDWERKNAKQYQEMKLEYQEFVKLFKKGRCHFCFDNLDFVDYNKPCCHWLLCPDKMKVKKFLLKLLMTEKCKTVGGFFQIQMYLRWIAKQESLFLNINDFESEIAERKMVELTIKYKNLEWSFSIDPSDYEGHQKSAINNYPHYHLQIKKNGFVILKFNDFHIPLSDGDLFFFQIKKECPEIPFQNPFGESAEEILKNMTGHEEDFIKTLKTAKNLSRDMFHTTTLLEAKDGKEISGNEFAQILKENKKTGVPLAVLAKKLKNVKQTTIISPGDGIIEIQKRSLKDR